MTENKIQSLRGMNDLLPAESALWQFVENKIKKVLNNYGYNEIRTPIVEDTRLFKRAVGEVTDIVEKEMYTFHDRNDESITLRPEITASCVRAGIEHGLFYNQEQRLWYLGPAFRYEKPQKGRYRQFHQFGVEVFGLRDPGIDAEMMILTARFWKELGIENHLELEINSIGSLASRANYRTALVSYLEKNKKQLDEDCLRRLYTNPLRILDSKNGGVQILLDNAPKLSEYLDLESKIHFSDVCQLLDNAGIKYRINERLVRGLDYYNQTVFEWITKNLGAQSAICGGGRYDGLVKQLGGKDTPAIGFGMGLERLVLLVKEIQTLPLDTNYIDIYMIYSSENKAKYVAQNFAEQLRDMLPNQRIMTHYGTGNFKKQFTKADKLGAKIAIIIGENEISTGRVVIKFLQTGEQLELSKQDAIQACLKKFQ